MKLTDLGSDPQVVAIKRRFPGTKFKDLVAKVSDVQVLPPDVVRLVARAGSKSGPLPRQVQIAPSTAAAYVDPRASGAPRVMSSPVATYESLVASRGRQDPLGDVTSTSAPHQSSFIHSDNFSAPVVDALPTASLVRTVPGTCVSDTSAMSYPMGGAGEVSRLVAPPRTLAELLLTPDPRGITVLDAGCSIATRNGGADALKEASLLGSIIDVPATAGAEVLSSALGTPVFLNVHEPFCFVTVGVQVCRGSRNTLRCGNCLCLSSPCL